MVKREVEKRAVLNSLVFQKSWPSTIGDVFHVKISVVVVVKEVKDLSCYISQEAWTDQVLEISLLLFHQSIAVNIQAFKDHLEDLHNPLVVELLSKARAIPIDVKVRRYEGEQQRKVGMKHFHIGTSRVVETRQVVIHGVGRQEVTEYLGIGIQ